MHIALKIILALPGLLFVFIGISFMLDPAKAVGDLGMPLLDDLGRSTQLGDLAAFFTSGGLMVLLGIWKQDKVWFLAPAMLLGLTAVYRTLAWTLHDAAFAGPQIAIEVVLAALLLFASTKTSSQ